ncbi:MAG: 16S rRNA (cytidine(1402)-2'-O)-methyltransferase [Corallococcus sp.]|nr:16S rRNA (cytidine(1402)-2'-O)-methyltransferase [Corallococcus sp.]
MVYFVATPIGNLKEITYRAVETLSSADVIFCEDTRHSQTLLSAYGIKKPTYSYHKFNEKSSLDFVLSFAKEGKNVAVISDAGMPCINDPGNILVNALKQNNLPYTVISGASAFVDALVLSGYKPPFTYIGFLPPKNKERERLLSEVNTDGVLIFYSAVHDVAKDMAYLYALLGERDVCVVKEISKLHEKVVFCKLSDAVEEDKGEFVLVVDRKPAEQNALCNLSIERHLRFYLDDGMDKQSAIKRVAKDRNVPKNEIYRYVADLEI